MRWVIATLRINCSPCCIASQAQANAHRCCIAFRARANAHHPPSLFSHPLAPLHQGRRASDTLTPSPVRHLAPTPWPMAPLLLLTFVSWLRTCNAQPWITLPERPGLPHDLALAVSRLQPIPLCRNYPFGLLWASSPHHHIPFPPSDPPPRHGLSFRACALHFW